MRGINGESWQGNEVELPGLQVGNGARNGGEIGDVADYSSGSMDNLFAGRCHLDGSSKACEQFDAELGFEASDLCESEG